jgi:hypothetical protein
VRDESVVEKSFRASIDAAVVKTPGPLPKQIELYSCVDDPPPMFDGGPGSHILTLLLTLRKGIQLLATVTVDLRKLPAMAFTELRGPRGIFYRVNYDIGIHFGSGGMEFRFIFNNDVVELAQVDYL